MAPVRYMIWFGGDGLCLNQDLLIFVSLILNI